MAISSKTDIVLGVSLAADPLKYMEAMDRLRQVQSSDSGAFTALLSDQGKPGGRAVVPGDPSVSSGPEDALNSGPPVPETARAAVRRKTAPKDVYGQLEAFIMQTFIQSMLPKEATAVFGKGTAGEVWKSMLAEKMGGEVARSGQLGIASRLAKSHLGANPAGRVAGPAPLPIAATLKSPVGDLARAPNALANALSALQESKTVGNAKVDKNGWVTTVQVAERS